MRLTAQSLKYGCNEGKAVLSERTVHVNSHLPAGIWVKERDTADGVQTVQSIVSLVLSTLEQVAQDTQAFNLPSHIFLQV